MSITKRWRDHIEAWQGSGLKRAAYCRQHAISHKTFAARLPEYRRLDGEEKPLLIPVTVTEGNIEPEPGTRPLVLILGQGHWLELPETVSAQWLSALLRGLG